jgi:hypothetical protein
MIDFKPDGFILAGSYLIAAWIMGAIGWWMYERKLKQGLVRERVSELFGTGRKLHYTTMVFHLAIAGVIAFIHWYIFTLRFDLEIEPMVLIVLGSVSGAATGFMAERPSRGECF